MVKTDFVDFIKTQGSKNLQSVHHEWTWSKLDLISFSLFASFDFDCIHIASQLEELWVNQVQYCDWSACELT